MDKRGGSDGPHSLRPGTARAVLRTVSGFKKVSDLKNVSYLKKNVSDLNLSGADLNLPDRAASLSRAHGLRLFLALSFFFLAAPPSRAPTQPVQGGTGQAASGLPRNSHARFPPEES